jgi:uncharacterized repeat protein (TIGR04138 family)
MSELLFADHVLDQLQERHPRFHARSYLFVLEALHGVIRSLPTPRHITGGELADGVRTLALERYGTLARAVLEHWGIHETEDVGRVVFAMVEQGILVKQDEDSPDDFVGLFDFEEVFERDYPWSAHA